MNQRATTENTEHTEMGSSLLGGRATPSPVPRLLRLPWFLILFLSSVAFGAEFRVGFAQANITPPIGWRRAGNYTELISTGVNDPLITKAMLVQDGATTFAFVGNDLCSVPRDLTDLARLRASRLTDIPLANIVITATHAHGGPEYFGPLRQFLHQRAMKANNGQDPHEPMDYRRQLVERWADVIATAWSNCQPASLEIVIPRLEGIAHNRRYWMKDGSVGWIPQEVQAVRFDADTALVTLPREVFTELGMAIKAGSPFRRTFVVTLANDLDFYIPTRRAFEEDNYEATTCPLEPGCGERLVAAAVKLLNELKS